jgi:hypothetical protein
MQQRLHPLSRRPFTNTNIEITEIDQPPQFIDDKELTSP